MDIVRLTESKDAYTKKVFKLIQGGAPICGDGSLAFTQSTIDELKDLAWQEVQSRTLEMQKFCTPDEAYQQQLFKIAGDMVQLQPQLAQNYPQMNTKLGYGTLADPTVYTQTNIPVMFGPTEAAAVYTNGGLPQQIVDKKTRAMVMHGTSYKSLDTKFWNADKIDMLEQAAQDTGLNDIIADGICDAFLQGGSILYPVFDTDTPATLASDRPQQGKILRWVETDRWNTTLVPSFIVTAADYLRPKTILVPMANVEVSTRKCCLMKPRQLPYWSALFNLGWCPSDLNGWMRAYYSYEITQMSVPVMAQQMSLLLYRMPLDGLNATIGPDNVEKLMNVNREEMRKWNSLNPQAVNMVGEVEVVNRTYSGFDLFVGATKSELSAQCGIPEPSLWHTPNKGFSDNMAESLLKQSEALQLAKQSVERTAQQAKDALIIHAFGADSPEYEKRKTLRMVFDKPVISTEKDMAEVGARFAASVNSFVQAGVSPDVAIELSKPFFPSIRVTEEMITKAKESWENQKAKIGGSNVGAKVQAPNTGHYTK